MDQPTRISDRHQRTRNDHATETAEDYVEAVHDIELRQGKCRVVDLARHFGVSHVTVSKIVKRLQKEGFVDTQPYRPIALTMRGRRLASKARHRHEVVYQFLLSIGVDEKSAAIDAEGIEHHVSPQTLRKFEQFTTKNTNQ